MKWTAIVIGLLAAQAALAETAHVDFDLGIVFPKRLGNIPFDRMEKYDNDALGYSLFYSDGTFTAEASVFNLGRTDIPDGPRGESVRVVFQGVEMEMERLAEGGAIAGVKKRGSMVVPKNAPVQLNNTVFQYSENRADAASGKSKTVQRINSVYAAGFKNHFIRVQFRFDTLENKKARAMADAMSKQLAMMLAAENSADDLILAACDAVINHPADYAGKAAAQRVFARTQEMGSLNVYDAFFVWPQDWNKPENADLLTAAYFAGMLRVVIPQQLESGGETEAFTAMVQAYENMRAADQIQSISQLDEWAKAQDKRALYKKLLVKFGYAAP